jgi:hypothetical protein
MGEGQMTGTETREQELQDAWKSGPNFTPNMIVMPITEDDIQRFDVGPITIVLENREVDQDAIRAHWDAFGGSAQPPEDVFFIKGAESGLSIHVLDALDGFEHLRFDAFGYHYLVRGLDGVIVMHFDPIANGEMIPWVLHSLRTRMTELLEGAGAFTLAKEIDSAQLDVALDEIEGLLGF